MTNTTTPPTYDYIIIGGGTSGVPLASRLSVLCPTSIVLLEAGPDQTTNSFITNPNAFPGLFSSDGSARQWTHDHSTTPQPHCNNRCIPNPAGRLLSGSSAVNVGVWMRASATDYELIAERAGHGRFAFESMLDVFKRVETHWNKSAGNEDWHGFDGPVHTVGGRKYPLRKAVQESAEKLGHKYNPGATQGDPTGLIDMTQCFRATSSSTSERQHSSRVYDLSGVSVQCESPVARVLFNEDKRAVGVELIDGRNMFARKEVIVCCGTQKTPQLLMLSGVGPKEELEKHGIDVVHDSPGVGQNLFDHSSLTMYFALKHPEQGLALPFTGTMKPEYGQGMPCDFSLFTNIPPSTLSPVLEADGLLPTSNADDEEEDIHPHLRPKRCHTLVFPIYYPVLATPEYNPTIDLSSGTHMSMVSLQILPVSRGSITLSSSSPSDPPLIDPRYLSTSADLFMLRTAVRCALNLASTSPLSDHILGETPPVPSPSNANTTFPALDANSTDGEIDARIRQYKGTIAHPMGTCALGTVLDSEFRVNGVEGLRVCDASVFPEPLGATPSATIFALGEMCAALIAGERGMEREEANS
ncbi:GMC oxidoreductase [Pleomassaria siparia CBS 279.74]|uniref:GMC oxidoreductase n=1 Tax=Pleomassaria siparia CBS 279.74 TaxID=1314801 RepID=A0A6G1KT80_9PLEO|nr:GMC oxidoreductase [Pleomassaria siparia CBS 279.74]